MPTPMPTPSVSVLVPVYNGAGTIAACLESLVHQAYPADAYEIIVVENGSTDETTAIVQAEAGPYPVRLLHSAQRGPAAARNLGLARSEADIVAFTDADCTPAADWLAELVKPYADPEIGGVGGQILACDRGERTMVERFQEQHPPLVNFVSGEHEFLPHLYTANGSYRRSLLDQIGGFNPGLITAQDVDVAWRVQLQTRARLCYAPRAVVYHRHRATRAGLARQYRRYGFGEILLDTIYRQQPGYPRNRRYQVRRILHQAAALPRYALSVIVQQIRAAAGRATPYQVAVPGLWLLIESSNMRGKLEAMVATRFMRDAQPALNMDAQILIRRLFPSHTD